MKEIRKLLTDLGNAVVEEREGEPVIRGYAAVWNAPTKLFPGMSEVIRRGAFTKTLREGDALSYWNHNSDLVLGRVSPGTLCVWEDDHGLAYELPRVDLGDYVHRHAWGAIKRREVRGSSFAFIPVRAPVSFVGERDRLRELHEVRLEEVSPVASPAYAATSVDARSVVEVIGLSDFDPVRALEELFAKGLTPLQLRASCEGVIEQLDRRDGLAPEHDAERDQMRRRLMLVGAEC